MSKQKCLIYTVVQRVMTLLLTGGRQRVGKNVYPFLQSVSHIGKVAACVKNGGKKLDTKNMFGQSESGMAMRCHNTKDYTVP